MNEKRFAAASSPVSGIALVQCERNGAALAHILNWLGEAELTSPPDWFEAFSGSLTADGKRFLAQMVGDVRR